MINILPYRQKKIVTQIRLLRAVTAVVVAVTILLLVAGALLLPTLVSVDSRYTIANNQITALEKNGMVTNPVDVAALQDRVSTLTKKLTAQSETAPTGYITTVRDSAGTGITLTGFQVGEKTDKPTLEVKGVATTREALQQYVAMLSKNEMIAAVDSPISNYVKNTNSDFSITVTFK